MLNAWHVSNGFLYELLQIKRRQLTRQQQGPAAMLDKYIVHATAKVRVVF
jgi:hypothetical protein